MTKPRGKTKDKAKQKREWWEAMIKRHGSREAVRHHMKQIGTKGGEKSRGGGFAAMPREKVQEAGRKGGKKSRIKK